MKPVHNWQLLSPCTSEFQRADTKSNIPGMYFPVAIFIIQQSLLSWINVLVIQYYHSWTRIFYYIANTLITCSCYENFILFALLTSCCWCPGGCLLGLMRCRRLHVDTVEWMGGIRLKWIIGKYNVRIWAGAGFCLMNWSSPFMNMWMSIRCLDRVLLMGADFKKNCKHQYHVHVSHMIMLLYECLVYSCH